MEGLLDAEPEDPEDPALIPALLLSSSVTMGTLCNYFKLKMPKPKMDLISYYFPYLPQCFLVRNKEDECQNIL